MRYLILPVVLIIIALFSACVPRFSGRSADFSVISKGLSSQVACVRSEKGEDQDTAAFLEKYEAGSYTRWKGNTGNTATRTFFFLNENGEELFTLTEMGNRGIISLSIDGEETLYVHSMQ